MKARIITEYLTEEWRARKLHKNSNNNRKVDTHKRRTKQMTKGRSRSEDESDEYDDDEEIPNFNGMEVLEARVCLVCMFVCLCI